MRAVTTFASRLGRAAVAALSAIRDRRDTSKERNEQMEAHAIQTLLSSGTQRQPSDGDPEEQMIAMLDEAALRLGKLMLDDSRDDEGKFLVSFEARVDVFKLLREWVEKRRRTGISDKDGDTSGVKSMIDAVKNGPQEAPRVETPGSTPLIVNRAAVMIPAPAPKRGPGRPTNEEKAARLKAEREAYDRQMAERAHDDSAMRADLERISAGKKVFS